MQNIFSHFTFLLITGIVTISCAQQKSDQQKMDKNSEHQQQTAANTATFGAGCFWCVEAIFENLEGVESVVSGYSGGTVENPSYKEICTGTTGYAEVCQMSYDPDKITYDELLEVFWQTHDPTTLNRQGADVGTQYRSAIFYHNEEQKALAEKYKKELDASGAWDKPIITEVAPFTKFYNAGKYHQDYYSTNPNRP